MTNHLLETSQSHLFHPQISILRFCLRSQTHYYYYNQRLVPKQKIIYDLFSVYI